MENKCDKCGEKPPSVFFSSVSGKFRISKHKYCNGCAESEKLKLKPSIVEIMTSGSQPQTMMDIVQKSLLDKKPEPKGRQDSTSTEIEKLEKSMKDAVGKEDYSKAAQIRDKIAELKGGTPPH